MSTKQTHYVMLGIKFKYSDFTEGYRECVLNDYEDNGYEKKVTNKDGITAILDGMNGEYIVVGRVISKGTEEEGLDMTELEFASLRDEREEVLNQIKGIPDLVDQVGFLSQYQVDLLVFTHWQ